MHEICYTTINNFIKPTTTELFLYKIILILIGYCYLWIYVLWSRHLLSQILQVHCRGLDVRCCLQIIWDDSSGRQRIGARPVYSILHSGATLAVFFLICLLLLYYYYYYYFDRVFIISWYFTSLYLILFFDSLLHRILYYFFLYCSFVAWLQANWPCLAVVKHINKLIEINWISSNSSSSSSSSRSSGRAVWGTGLDRSHTGSRIRIPLKAWMFVLIFLCCVVLCR
jgi:hypothetical protein